MIETLLEEDATERHVVLPPMPIAGMAPIAVVWNAVLGYGVIVSKRSYIRQYHVVVVHFSTVHLYQLLFN